MKRLSLILLAALPTVASAHAFGQQYTLPLPLRYYLVGAALALIASFAILGFLRRPREREARNLRPRWYGAFARTLSYAGLAAFLGTLAVAFFGSSDFLGNPAPILFWIVLLLAVPYLSVLVGDVWERMNPFRMLTQYLLGNDYPALLPYPKRLGYLPAIVLYFGLIWLELLSLGLGASPLAIGVVLVSYLLLSFFGSGLFGVDAWFQYGDLLGILFRLLSMLAPIRLRSDGIEIEAPGERLVRETPERLSLLFLILFMLASTAFDGLKDTAPWVAFFTASPGLLDYYVLGSYVGLLLAPFCFFAFYAMAVVLMKWITRSAKPLGTLLLRFGYSLIPIAIAYHFAHYFTLLVSEEQSLIPMLSDPFDRGWDLFGTASYTYNVGLIGAGTVWYLQVAAIVGGHILATYIAHRIALVEFPQKRDVMLGQLPMLGLMVCYTVFGLWILSLPFASGAL